MNVTQTHRELGAHRPGELLVRLNEGASLATDVAGDLEAQIVDRFELPNPGSSLDGRATVLHLKLPESTSTEQAMDKLANDPRVRYAVPNHIFELDVQERRPDDLSHELWGMQAIHAPEAWAVTTGSNSGPVIAVLDTGVDVTHPDLMSNLWTNTGEIPGNGIDDDGNGVVDDIHGYNPNDNSGNVQDGHRHGTHTAGTIGAVGNNGQGVVGVNWQARIMAIKIFDDNGRTSAASIIKGLEYANKMGARITSNSWGGTQYNEAIKDAFAGSTALHIAAAGNSRTNTDLKGHYPSTYDLPNMVSVAATTRNDSRASFSNYGAVTVDLAAPGQDIVSTVPGGGTESLNGTSMACPHVSGVAGLIATLYPQASNEEIKKRLLSGVDQVESLQGVVATGGRLNAARSLEDDKTPPGTPGQFQVQSSDSRSLTLTWIAPGDDQSQGTASRYDLRVSDRPMTDEESFQKARAVPVSGPRSGGSRENLVLPVRPSELAQEVYVALKASDNVGNISPMVSARGQVIASQKAFQDEGPSSWTIQGDWAQVEGDVWTDSPGGDLVPGKNSVLSSQPFSLKGLKNATLVFDAKHDLDDSGGDVVWVQVSKDGGRNWSPVGSLTGRSDWQPHGMDLSAYDGKNIQFQFTLISGGFGRRDGIYLKGLKVLGEPR